MPYENQHAARVESPDKFEKDSFRSKDIAPGVRIIVGKKKGSTTMSTQTYRFDSSKFTASEAKAWLKKHNISPISFEVAKSEKAMNKAMIKISKNLYIKVLKKEFNLNKAEELPTKKNRNLLSEDEIRKTWKAILSLDMSGNKEKKIGKINGIDIWLMDFNKLKVEMDADTIEGTNSSVLKEKHESAKKFDFASVDFDIAEHERPFIILHEIIEKTLMDKHGLKYNPAHAVANAIEKEYREKYLKPKSKETYRI